MHPPPAPQTVIQRLAGIDLRALATLRIALAVLLLWDTFTALINAGAFFTEAGVLPLSVARQLRESEWMLSLHDLGSTALVTALLLVQLGAALCLLAGWRSQLAALVCWLLLCSLQTRNPAVLHGGDTALRLLLFWSLLLPLGARWSLDALAGRTSVFFPAGRIFTAASLALLMQVAFIYWFTAVLKWGHEWTRDGTAVYYALSADQFVQSPGLLLLGFPDLCRALTFAVLWLELAGPFLAFLPWQTARLRIAVVAAFWLLHLGLALCLRLGPFPFVMMAAWLPFLPTEFWDWLGKKFRQPERRMAAHSQPCDRWMNHGLAQALALICLVYVTLWNLRTVHFERWVRVLPTWANAPAYLLRLDQYWALFAPRPLKDDGWLVLEAVLADGSRVDLLRDGRPVSFDKPSRISAEYPDFKWHKLGMNLPLARYVPVRAAFGNYFSTKWNNAPPPEQRVVSWTLIHMRELTLPQGNALRPERVELARSEN